MRVTDGYVIFANSVEFETAHDIGKSFLGLPRQAHRAGRSGRINPNAMGSVGITNYTPNYVTPSDERVVAYIRAAHWPPQLVASWTLLPKSSVLDFLSPGDD